MAKQNPEAQDKAPNNTGEILKGDFQMWRGLALDLAPKIAAKAGKSDDAEWQINELATAMQEACCLLGEHWPKLQSIISKSEKKAGGVSVKVDVNRNNNPSEVDAKVSYSENYAESVKRKVPDPNQGTLGFDDAPDADPEKP